MEHPELFDNNIYDIWMEGYAATGQRAVASYLGREVANTFKLACAKRMLTYPESRIYYDPIRNTYWGCKLYDNEQDARRYFG